METSPAVVTLILGGARSGKSRYAQMLASRAENVVYLATARICDEEMRAKVERHRRERPAIWKTVEAPLCLEEAVMQHAQKDSFLLIDCLATYTTNLMEAENGNQDAIMARVERLRSAVCASTASVAIVSNEVGSGVVPPYPSGRQFRDLLGEINQMMAQVSRNVVLMVAGCPLALKGVVEVLP